ncbi:hypothetical protein AB0J72_56640 [Dactylosporangium sp. NPDC049742]|uniref:hypothetical protein n=1 Tax=Dactylosporangium sp. NPDC049742 TaxID=3154737 RepID=UPI00343B255C
MNATTIEATTERKARPAPAHTWAPTTDTGDVMLRLCRAERRVEALAVQLLCGEGATPARRQAAELLDDLRS